MSTALVPKEASNIQEEGLVLIGQAEELEIIDKASADDAGRFLQAIKQYQARVKEIMDPIVKAADHAHKVAVQQRNLLLGPALEAEQNIKRSLVSWEQAEQDRLKAQREAQEKAAREAGEAERDRQAKALLDQGKPAAAAAVAAAPPPVAITPPPPAPPKVQGVSFKDVWSAEVTSKLDLVKAVAEGKQPLELLDANMTVLNKLAVALKEHLNIPGVAAKHGRVPASSR